jgi:hypothetical protein
MTIFQQYQVDHFFDEMMMPGAGVRPHYQFLYEYLSQQNFSQLDERQQYIEKMLMSLGITFNVYHEEEGTERIFPFDFIPRIIPNQEFNLIQAGITQRITALNAFLNDIYHDQKILNDRIIPKELVLESKGFLPQCMGLNPPKGIWCHISGIDLVKAQNGRYVVLEDNLRCPSGVAYVLENREIMKKAFASLVEKYSIRPVSNYPYELYQLLQYISANDQQTSVLLTPGIYNSAYFEHAFLARQMGIQLVQPSDLVVTDGYVKMKTTEGLKRVDAIYRRIDDIFLDPKVFRPDSLLGIPGLFDVYQKGKVALINAPGTGVADDKAIYPFVPQMIQYYLSETPILENVPTYICSNKEDKKYVIEHLNELVVKSANEAGGYGMLMGPYASEEERKKFKVLIESNPRNYIAQPIVNFSRTPSFFKHTIEGRHVDLRPYTLFGKSVFVLSGGLTRVALRKGSLVVNSSQGGGSKDTWVLSGD